MILGVVPAGGKAERFNGYFKEMLPIQNGTVLLDRAIESLRIGGADVILVLTTPGKIALHAQHLGPGVDYRIRDSENLWETLGAIFSYGADRILYAQPDTFYPVDIFSRPWMKGGSLSFGCFKTRSPERFGVLLADSIVDKEPLPAGEYTAWGVISWSRSISDFFKEGGFSTQAEALNKAFQRYGATTVPMEYYYDMANWDHYLEFLSRSPTHE